ncbi:hypothetical protein MAHJHV63_50130 [Mycobacterium avium subsp. hominissuis]
MTAGGSRPIAMRPAVTQGLEARVEYWLPGYAVPLALAATALTAVAASASGTA